MMHCMYTICIGDRILVARSWLVLAKTRVKTDQHIKTHPYKSLIRKERTRRDLWKRS